MARPRKTDLAPAEEPKLPANITNVDNLMRQHAGEGLDEVGAADILIPRLAILQGLSPQVIANRPEFDPNARAGQIYDIGLRESFPDGIHVIFAYYCKVWNEWAPRTTGKGIIRAHRSNAILSNTRPGENNQAMLPNGNVVIETAEFYVLNLSAKARPSFIPMAVTQLKEARRIMTYVMSEEVMDGEGVPFRAPIYYRSYRLTTVPTSNAKGNWMLWKCERDKPLAQLPDAERLFNAVQSFRQAVMHGNARGDATDEWNDSESSSGSRRNEGPL